MKPLVGIKPSFSGGEFAPSLYSRVDLAKYAIGTRKLRNFIVHPHGGISNRAGLYYIATEKTAGKKIRLIGFEFSTEQTYVIEFGEYYCRFYKDGAPISKTAGSAWVTSTVYAVDDIVSNAGIIYKCLIAHTSGTFADDLTALKWEIETNKWITGTAYVVGDYVYQSSTFYYCLIAHTSGVFATDLAAGKWVARSIYEIVTTYAAADLAKLNYTQSADVLYITHPDFAPRQLERHGNTDWEWNLYDFSGGPFMLANTDETKLVKISAVTGTGKTLTATGFTFNPGHVGALWQLRHYIEGQAVSAALDDAAEVSTSIKCGGTWRFISHGTWTGTIRIEKSTTNAFAGEETLLREFSSADDFNANTYGTEDMSDNAEPFYVRIKMTARTSGTCNINLSSDPFSQEGIVKITAVASGGATATATIVRTCGLTTDTIDWAEGSWSDYRGWPAIVEFHPEDRLMFGNTYGEPQTYWTTKSGNYTDFSRSSPLVDSDGISSPLPSRKVNGINGFIPLNEMVALTLSNEVSIRSSSGPISPTTAYNKIHGWEGSYGIRPVLIGNRAIYVQSTGSIIRDLGYQWSSDTFEGADLTIFSNHLFTGHTIVDMAYQQNPDRIVWAIRDDGILLSMTYMREQEVIAWTWHDTNRSGALDWVTATAYVAGNWVEYDGETYLCNTNHTSGTFATDLAAGKWTLTAIEASFESVCTIRGDGYDEVWFSVNRGGTRYIERMVRRMASTEPEDQFFVDCGKTYDSDSTPITTMTGLDHLEGCTVAVLADGNVLGQKVVTGGQISLGGSYHVVHAGLPYLSDLETLNIDVNLEDGTAQGRKIKIPNVVIRFLNSRGGYIGPNESNLHEVPASTRATYDDPLELYSGDQPITLGGGFSDGGRMFFRQSQPLPVTISALIPVVTIGGVSQLI